jgi:GalNAc5-diNAcBac-PP-undecaprenol beta-1,3-glucosyltransferase
VTDATIVIPTFRHAALLPYALRSALDQDGASVEVIVVGDGVEDDTREALEPFLSDERVRFADLPKGPRHGELNRHDALREASGRIVCYLSDDDLLLRNHVSELCGLLRDADFAHAVSARFVADGTLEYFPWNYGRSEFVEIARGRKASIGLTGVGHTLEAYRRLPHGWRTAPREVLTDHHMWLQWLDLQGLRAAMGDRLTYLTFPDPAFGRLAVEERAAMLGDWLRRSREPRFAVELEAMLQAAIRRAAEDYHLWARNEQLMVQEMRATRTWRLRDRVVSAAPLRALLARLNAGS